MDFLIHYVTVYYTVVIIYIKNNIKIKVNFPIFRMDLKIKYICVEVARWNCDKDIIINFKRLISNGKCAFDYNTDIGFHWNKMLGEIYFCTSLIKSRKKINSLPPPP